MHLLKITTFLQCAKSTISCIRAWSLFLSQYTLFGGTCDCIFLVSNLAIFFCLQDNPIIFRFRIKAHQIPLTMLLMRFRAYSNFDHSLFYPYFALFSQNTFFLCITYVATYLLYAKKCNYFCSSVNVFHLII
jgi:hypothetical protein